MSSSVASTGAVEDAVARKCVRGTVTPRTEARDLPAGATRGVSASPDAGTDFGRIHHAPKIHHAFKSVDGVAVDPNIHATTAHGDITARSLLGAFL